MIKSSLEKPGSDSRLYRRTAKATSPQAVTFDCWSTLIYEKNPDAVYRERVLALLRVAKAHGIEISEQNARASLDRAWREHWERWQREETSSPKAIAFAALRGVGLQAPHAVERLVKEFVEIATASEIISLTSAHETLAALARENIATALICDTGFSPGVVVRELLRREGLLSLLTTQVFSNEAGVSKPNPRIFQAALANLQTAPNSTVHVGDLRRTDIAGARRMGMATIRITEHHDDQSDTPEADVVVTSHANLRDILHLS